METAPDTENVLYMDEYRRAKWTAELRRARESGRVAVFGAVYETEAAVLEFPEQRPPDDAA